MEPAVFVETDYAVGADGGLVVAPDTLVTFATASEGDPESLEDLFTIADDQQPVLLVDFDVIAACR